MMTIDSEETKKKYLYIYRILYEDTITISDDEQDLLTISFLRDLIKDEETRIVASVETSSKIPIPTSSIEDQDISLAVFTSVSDTIMYKIMKDIGVLATDAMIEDLELEW